MVPVWLSRTANRTGTPVGSSAGHRKQSAMRLINSNRGPASSRGFGRQDFLALRDFLLAIMHLPADVAVNSCQDLALKLGTRLSRGKFQHILVSGFPILAFEGLGWRSYLAVSTCTEDADVVDGEPAWEHHAGEDHRTAWNGCIAQDRWPCRNDTGGTVCIVVQTHCFSP